MPSLLFSTLSYPAFLITSFLELGGFVCAERRTGPCDVEKMSDATTVTKKRCPSATILIAACTDLFTLKTKITADKNTVPLYKTLLTHTQADTFVIVRLQDPGTLSACTSRALSPAPRLNVFSNCFRDRPVLEPVVGLTRTATLIVALARTFESDLDSDDDHQYEDDSSDEFELSFEFDVIRGVWRTALKSTGQADDLCTTVLGTILPSASATSLSSDAKIPPGVDGHGPLVSSLLRNMHDAQLQSPAHSARAPLLVFQFCYSPHNSLPAVSSSPIHPDPQCHMATPNTPPHTPHTLPLSAPPQNRWFGRT
ncbi:hypothetical protein B0H14DRAFT_3483103 [Mycena olivaceomarginata]|nr:hypothetical protein B0H14DRAFT_3483103 [Mycena olivaceomarginata]